MVRAYTLPPKYGSIAKAYVVQNDLLEIGNNIELNFFEAKRLGASYVISKFPIKQQIISSVIYDVENIDVTIKKANQIETPGQLGLYPDHAFKS